MGRPLQGTRRAGGWLGMDRPAGGLQSCLGGGLEQADVGGLEGPCWGRVHQRRWQGMVRRASCLGTALNSLLATSRAEMCRSLCERACV